MITLEMVKNAAKAMEEGFERKDRIFKKLNANAKAENRELNKEEKAIIAAANIENSALYDTWKALKNQRAREMRRARA